jgi:hypothetical protein
MMLTSGLEIEHRGQFSLELTLKPVFGVQHFEKEMTLAIEREGKELEVSFWPRTWYTVECWQWRPL